MKRRRALLFIISLVLALCAACGWWLHRERQQYALNRQLITALEHDDTKTALALVNAGADSNTREYAPPVPTLPQLLQQLLRHKPTSSKDTDTALILACGPHLKSVEKGQISVSLMQEDVPLVQGMLAHGADVRLSGRSSETALHKAANANRLRTVQLLVQHGANVNAQNFAGWTPLMSAASNETADITQLLLAHGADVNARTNYAITPLMLATQTSTRNVVHVLLQQGADPNAQDEGGVAALHYAVNGRNPKDIIPELLAQGANPNLKDKQGQTPFLVAQHWNRHDAMRLLKQHGAK